MWRPSPTPRRRRWILVPFSQTRALRAMMPALLMLVSASAVAVECDARAEQIAAEVGATVRTRIGPAIKMQHPEAENLSVNCRDSILSRVSGSRDAPGSIAGFGLLMSRASSLALGD